MNDADREQWITNDEALYTWQQESRLSMRAFIRANRTELDQIIKTVLNAPPREKTWRDYV